MAELVYNVRDVRTIRELFETTVQEHSDKVAFLYRSGEAVREVTYDEAFADVRALATYLNSLGLSGKKIALMGKNCYNWALTYLAVTCGVGVIVPIDKELKSVDVENIMKLSGAAALIVTPELETLAAECSENVLSTAGMEQYLQCGRELMLQGDDSYDRHRIDPDALGVLLYTSGTTGAAKGVMLSQHNICADIVAVLKKVYVDSTERTLSILPLHHTYECTAGFLAMVYCGASIAYSEGLRRIPAELKLFQPTIFIGVPLIFETIHRNIVEKYSAVAAGRLLISAARRIPALRGRKSFSKVHEFFGGKCRRLLCGAASMDPDIFRDYEMFGFDVYIGYGLTECSPVCIMHNDSYRCAEDIGEPLSCLKAKLIDVNEDGVGELAVKGTNVMLGYYNDPESTANAIDAEGWFHTGDLATVDDKGHYRIVGRVKTMIVTKNGKKIFPEELEVRLAGFPEVRESMAYGIQEGDGDTVVAVRIFPDNDVLAAKLGERAGDRDAVLEHFTSIVKTVNKDLPHYKAIRKTFIRDREFAKTTTRKIKRADEENLR